MRSEVVGRWKNYSKVFCLHLRITNYCLKNLFRHWYWKLPLTFTIFHQSKKAIDDRRDNCDEFLLMYCIPKLLQAILIKTEYSSSVHIQKVQRSPDTIVKFFYPSHEVDSFKEKKSMRIKYYSKYFQENSLTNWIE